MSKQQEKQSGDNPFSSSTTTSDVVLVVEDKKLHVSRSILAWASPVFERMFYGEFKEKYSAEIKLPGKKYDDMVKFLVCIYPATFVPVDKGNVEAVMMLAGEYQVQRLLDNCIKYLIDTDEYYGKFIPDEAEMVHILHITESRDKLKKVYDHYLDLVVRKCHFHAGAMVGEFNQISLETRYKVVLKRLQIFDSKIPNKTF